MAMAAWLCFIASAAMDDRVISESIDLVRGYGWAVVGVGASANRTFLHLSFGWGWSLFAPGFGFGHSSAILQIRVETACFNGWKQVLPEDSSRSYGGFCIVDDRDQVVSI
jgi:hypothetical protein